MTIYLLGTVHIGRCSARKIERAFQKYEFDAVFSEGVRGFEHGKRQRLIEKTSLLRKDMFLAIGLLLYGSFIDTFGKDTKSLRGQARKYRLKIYSIDLSIEKLLKKALAYPSWFRALFPVGIFALIFHAFTRTILWILHALNIMDSIIFIITVSAVISLFVTILVYFCIFVLVTKKMRDESFSSKTKELIQKHGFSNVLVVCGKRHTRQLRRSIDVVEL